MLFNILFLGDFGGTNWISIFRNYRKPKPKSLKLEWNWRQCSIDCRHNDYYLWKMLDYLKNNNSTNLHIIMALSFSALSRSISSHCLSMSTISARYWPIGSSILEDALVAVEATRGRFAAFPPIPLRPYGLKLEDNERFTDLK